MAAYPAALEKFVEEFIRPYVYDEEDGALIVHEHPVGGGGYYVCGYYSSDARGRCNLEGLLARLNGFGYQWPNYTPEQWVLDALRDAASAEYYYAFEKDYR